MFFFFVNQIAANKSPYSFPTRTKPFIGYDAPIWVKLSLWVRYNVSHGKCNAAMKLIQDERINNKEKD